MGMSECKHDFLEVTDGEKEGHAFVWANVWNVGLITIVLLSIFLYQFYWIVLILLFNATWKTHILIYCKNCGDIRTSRKDGEE